MPSTVKGPGILIAQFAGDEPPFNTWPRDLPLGRGPGLQGHPAPGPIDPRFFHLQEGGGNRKALLRRDRRDRPGARHCDHRALHKFVRPARRCESGFRRGFRRLRSASAARADRESASVGRSSSFELAALASRNLGLSVAISFTGALAWPFFYPWPRRPSGLIVEALPNSAADWRPILDASSTRPAVDVAYELHPGEDVFDGATFERFPAGGRRSSALAPSTTTRRISCCRDWTISPLSISTIRASAPSTSKTPNSIRAAVRASIPGTRRGWSGPAAFALLGDGQTDFGYRVLQKLAA